MSHASEYLNHISLKTRIKLTTTYISLNSDYLCSNRGLARFNVEVLNTTALKSRNCGTMISNNGGAHMLLTNQDSDSNFVRAGISRSSTICDCTNR